MLNIEVSEEDVRDGVRWRQVTCYGNLSREQLKEKIYSLNC